MIMNVTTRIGRRWLAGVLAGAGILASAPAAGTTRGDDGDDGPGRPASVFVLTNAAAGNELAAFRRDGRGNLAPAGRVPTGGLGTGGGLGNQGALSFGDDGRYLYAVNAGSDSLSVFFLHPRGPILIQVIPSGGRRPVGLAVHDEWLYVVNAGGAVGGADSIQGFAIDPWGFLIPIPDSARPLSAPSTAPAQVGFNNDGSVLVVTEKATNRISTYLVNHDGSAAGPIVQNSVGATPFGFAFNRDDLLIVSEAFGGAPDASAVSSYEVGPDGTLDVMSASVPTTESAACWIANTRDAEFSYTTNTASGTISGYRVDEETGGLSLLDADGRTAVTGPGTAPTDLAIVGNRLLFVLNSDTGTVGAFAIGRDGSLAPLRGAGGLLAAATGLIAR